MPRSQPRAAVAGPDAEWAWPGSQNRPFSFACSALIIEGRLFGAGEIADCLYEAGYSTVEAAELSPAGLAACALIVIDVDGAAGAQALEQAAALDPALRRRILLVSADADKWEAERAALRCGGLVDKQMGELHLLTAVADALWQEGAAPGAEEGAPPGTAAFARPRWLAH